jgi:hypothetical protein
VVNFRAEAEGVQVSDLLARVRKAAGARK